jgi:hypothetical protein
MSTFDIIIITIIILIIVVLFTINISSVIDDKLSNVEINIPPINIPDPQITVKIQKSCGSENYDVYIDKPNSTIHQNTVALSPVNTNEHFESGTVVVENSTTLPNKNIKLQKEESMSEKKHVHDDKDNVFLTCKKLENGEYRCVNASKMKYDVKHEDTCHNKSLLEQKRNEYYDIINGDNDSDPTDYHRQYEYHVKSYLEDPIMRGYNINEYNHNASLDQIGKIKLSKDYKNPKPSGYIFDSSPIYEK